MSYPTGQVLSAPIVNGSSNDLFGTHIDYLGVGGYRSVATIANRNAIPTKSSLEYDGLGSGMRRHLMLVAVQETGLIYILYKSDFQVLLTDSDRLTALQNNDNWISLPNFLQVVNQNSGTIIGELPEYLASTDGLQSFTLPINTAGVFDINILSSSGICKSVYQKYYTVTDSVLTISNSANIVIGDKICGSYYIQHSGNLPIVATEFISILDVQGDDSLTIQNVSAS